MADHRRVFKAGSGNTFAVLLDVSARFRLPERCKLCGAIGTVSRETTITRGVVFLSWCCRSCRGDWPITSEDEESREEEDWQTPHSAQ